MGVTGRQPRMRGPAAESVESYAGRLAAARAVREKVSRGEQRSLDDVAKLEAADVAEALHAGALSGLGMPPARRRR
jgi:hypothetical protein